MSSIPDSRRLAALLVLCLCAAARAQSPLSAEAERRVSALVPKVVAWRRDFHAHPELSNREERTARIVAEHLRSLGLSVRTGVARHGVVGTLQGGKPGPVVALRADMDGLPVTEAVKLPFASKIRTRFNGQEVGVMHACGHDTHTAMLMGTAELLAGLRHQLPGTVKFIFQPAEEGPPPGEQGGAAQMVKEGALENPKPDAIFALHVGVTPEWVGTVSYRPGPMMAASDRLRIVVHGKGAHGASPWRGVDPIVVGSQIVLAVQTLVSRQADLTRAPAVVTIGSFQGGVRGNIIPESVEMHGTLRTFDRDTRDDLHRRLRRTVELIAQSAGASAELSIEPQTPVTLNAPDLVERMKPTLERVAGPGNLELAPAVTGAEDFAEFQARVPGMMLFLGAVPRSTPLEKAALNHSPFFEVDEAVLPLGVRVLTHLTLDALEGNAGTRRP